MSQNKFKMVSIPILILNCFFLQSCSVIYKAPYYVPNDSKNWTYEDRLKEYSHPRYYISSRNHISSFDTLHTQVIFGHLRGSFGSGAKAKWVGFILPIIPQISFSKKHEMVFNSQLEVTLNTTIVLDTSKVSIILNEKFTQKPYMCEVFSLNSVNRSYDSSLFDKDKTFYSYRFYAHIQNDEVLRKMKSIKINVAEPKMKWLNDVIFIRKNKSVWCMFEGAN